MRVKRETLTDVQVRALLRDATRNGLRAWCREHGVQAATVSRIINGKLPIQNKVLIALKLKRVVRYERMKR